MSEDELVAFNLVDAAEKVSTMEHRDFGLFRDRAEQAAILLSKRINQYDLEEISRKR